MAIVLWDVQVVIILLSFEKAKTKTSAYYVLLLDRLKNKM